MQPNDPNDMDTRAVRAADRVKRTVGIMPRTKNIMDGALSFRLTIIDTPGFADSIDNRDCWRPLADYIDQTFEKFLYEENKLDRKTIIDERVHALLYFINPSSHG